MNWFARSNARPLIAGAARQASTPRRRRQSPRQIGRMRYAAIGACAFVAIGFVWWVISEAGFVKPLFLPSPDRVVQRLIQLAADGDLVQDLSISAIRIFVAFAMSCVLAIPLGILMGTSRFAEAVIEPVTNFIRYMPVVAFIPLTILWTGTGEFQKYLIIWIGTFFQQILMVQDSVKRVPGELIDVGRTLEMPGRDIMLRIVLPCAAPGIWDSMRISIGWAWSWLVLAELVAATSGLGYRITVAQRYFQTDTIIAYVLLLGLLGLITDQIMKVLSRRMFRYSEGARR